MYFLERPVWNFVVGVGLGSQTAQERDAHLELQCVAAFAEAEQGSGLLVGVILGTVGSDAVAFPCSCFAEGLVCFGIEVDGVCPAVVPASTDACVAAYFMVGENLYFRTNKLLCFPCIGYRAFSQKETGINSQ